MLQERVTFVNRNKLSRVKILLFYDLFLGREICNCMLALDQYFAKCDSNNDRIDEVLLTYLLKDTLLF